MHLTLFVGFVLLCISLCSFNFFAIIVTKERAGCFALTVFLVSCDYKCSVALPRGAVGLFAVCDSGIS